MLGSEDDKDFDNNQGCFKLDQNFRVCVLTDGSDGEERLNEIKLNLKLPLEVFDYVKIIDMDWIIMITFINFLTTILAIYMSFVNTFN